MVKQLLKHTSESQLRSPYRGDVKENEGSSAGVTEVFCQSQLTVVFTDSLHTFSSLRTGTVIRKKQHHTHTHTHTTMVNYFGVFKISGFNALTVVSTFCSYYFTFFFSYFLFYFFRISRRFLVKIYYFSLNFNLFFFFF